MTHYFTVNDYFVSDLIKKQSEVDIFLKNGSKLKGKLVGVTNNLLFIKHELHQAIYKSAVNSIVVI